MNYKEDYFKKVFFKMLAAYKQNITLAKLQQDEEKLAIPTNSYYFISYPEFLRYFKEIQTITTHHLVIGISFSYAWMPTIFDFRSNNFPEVIRILNSAKRDQVPNESELKTLKECFNNSMVGTSKLLHFINPTKFAIWDSRVYRYLTHQEPHSYRLNNCNAYLAYLKFCEHILTQPGFHNIHRSLVKKVGYEITPYRAIELIMYFNGGRLIDRQL